MFGYKLKFLFSYRLNVDLNLFFIDKNTLEEINILKQVKNKFLSFGSKDIVNFSHQEKAFTNTKFYNKISYDFAFDIDDL